MRSLSGDHSCESLSFKICEQQTDLVDPRCFYTSSSLKASPTDAKQICNCNDMTLVSPQDEQTMDFLKINFQFDFWIDLSRTALDKFTFLQTDVECSETIKGMLQLAVLRHNLRKNRKKFREEIDFPKN